MTRRISALVMMLVFVATMVLAFGAHDHHANLGEASNTHCAACGMLSSSATEPTVDAPVLCGTDFGFTFLHFTDLVVSRAFSSEPPARAPPLA